MSEDKQPQPPAIRLTTAEEKLVLRLRQLKSGMAILYLRDGEFRFVPLPKLEEIAN